MKIEFENDKEKEILKHILLEWLCDSAPDNDVLGCEPACRDDGSPNCSWCVNYHLNKMINKNKIIFSTFGGEDWLLNECSINNFITESQAKEERKDIEETQNGIN